MGSFDLKGRPPLVRITGSIHDAGVTKTAAGNRDIPLTIFQTTLPARVRSWLEEQRPPSSSVYLVLSERADALGNPRPLTRGAVTLMLTRLEETTGIHANPYRFRHTFCTGYAEGGGEPFHLMYLMGHSSLAMVARYFRGRLNRSLLEAATRVRV